MIPPDPTPDDPELRDGIWVKCPNDECGKEFRLIYADLTDKTTTLKICACLSGGIYGVDVVCPHCKHEEDILA